MTEELTAALWLKLPGLLVAPALNRIRRRTDYASYSGAPLLGVNGVCIISHGRSSPLAIANAIRLETLLGPKTGPAGAGGTRAAGGPGPGDATFAAGEAVCHDIVSKIGARAAIAVGQA